MYPIFWRPDWLQLSSLGTGALYSHLRSDWEETGKGRTNRRQLHNLEVHDVCYSLTIASKLRQTWSFENKHFSLKTRTGLSARLPVDITIILKQIFDKYSVTLNIWMELAQAVPIMQTFEYIFKALLVSRIIYSAVITSATSHSWTRLVESPVLI